MEVISPKCTTTTQRIKDRAIDMDESQAVLLRVRTTFF